MSFGENHERLERIGRQALPRNEPGTSRQPVFERSQGRWSQGWTVSHPCLTRDSNPEPLMKQSAPLSTTPVGRRIFEGYISKNKSSLRIRTL